jgi:lipooligosaccharide transport system permease protein
VFITTRFFPTRPLGSSRAHKVLERDVLVYRRNWTIIVTGFFEPIFYLLGIGFGLGTLVGDVGDIPYAAFVAPGLMATAAMNGALFEATFNLFFKLKYAKTFDAILATPLGPSDIAIGEVSWALTRGLLYATAFLIVMLLLGLVLSPLGILMIPGALLIGLAAASVGMAATTWMRKWQDFDVVTVVTMPMFLFSGTFFPISVYPAWLETIVELTPLYRGVHMLRSFSTGEVGPTVVLDIAYLGVMGLIGVAITARRLRSLLLK